MGTAAGSTNRWVALDQYRGYTVLGMFFVNFVGSFEATPYLFKHNHTYCSYADTIMPQFFFAVGMAYRLTFLRRCEKDGFWPAVWHAIKRNLGLILLGIVVYHLDGGVKTWADLEQLTFSSFLAACKRNVFQTLVHIGVTSLWILPVIWAPGWVRLLYAIASGVGHFCLSYGIGGWSYYVWVHTDPRGIDGGPLGFLTWTIPMVAGTMACDWSIARGEQTPWNRLNYLIVRLVPWGLVLMMAGYLMECYVVVPQPLENSALPAYYSHFEGGLPPFINRDANMPSRLHVLTMSQRAGSVSYLTFATGFAMALYGVFVLLCDVRGWQVRVFRTLGTNALAAYLIHDLVNGAIKPWTPKDAPFWFVLAGFGLSFAICYFFLRFLEERGLYLRL